MPPRWLLLHPKAKPETLGYIPAFFDEDDPRSAAEQLNENYAHGGGWKPVRGVSITRGKLKGESGWSEPMLAMSQLHDEKLVFFRGSWLAIIQPDGSFEIGRID